MFHARLLSDSHPQAPASIRLYLLSLLSLLFHTARMRQIQTIGTRNGPGNVVFLSSATRRARPAPGHDQQKPPCGAACERNSPGRFGWVRQRILASGGIASDDALG
jgi:hypothetical protein